MEEIWTSLLPILLADIVNPVLFGFMVYAAGTDKPVANSSAMLLGHTAAYLGAGIALSFGLEAISERIANPHSIDFAIEFLVALVLLALAFRSPSAERKEPEKESPTFTPLSAFGFGVVINFVGIPFAVPYFAAISQILKLDPSFMDALYLLMVYNILYAAPFMIVPLLVVAMGDRSQATLARLNAILNRVSGFLLPVLLFLVAVALLADAGTYFWTGTALF